MNSKLIPVLVLICLVPLPAFGLEAQLDKTDYYRNQTVTITGTLVPSNDTSAIMEIWILQKNVWYDRVAIPNPGENFTRTMPITDAWEKDGMYIASIQYNGEDVRIPFTVSAVPTPEEVYIDQITAEIEEEVQNNNSSDDNDDEIQQPILNNTSTNQTSTVVDQVLQNEIPGWVKIIFVFWTNGQVSDSELLDAIKFLVNNGVLVL